VAGALFASVLEPSFVYALAAAIVRYGSVRRTVTVDERCIAMIATKANPLP